MFVQSEYIYMFHSILEFEQSWNFFPQLYNYSKKILYETQQNIYLESARRDLQNGVKILVKIFSKQKILWKLEKKILKNFANPDIW